MSLPPLLVAGDDFFRPSIAGDEDDEVPEEIEQIGVIEEPVERGLHLIEGIDFMRPRVAPLQPELHPPPRHAIHHPRFIHPDAVEIGVEELIDLLRIHAELYGTLPPIRLGPAGRLGLNHHDRDAIEEQHDVRAPVRAAFDGEFVRHRPIVVRWTFEIDEPHVFGFLRRVELVIHPVAHPANPLLVIPAGPQLGEDGIHPGLGGEHRRVECFELLPQRGQEQHFPFIVPAQGEDFLPRAVGPTECSALQMLDHFPLDGRFLGKQAGDAGGGSAHGEIRETDFLLRPRRSPGRGSGLRCKACRSRVLARRQ